jgi:signal recognition particle subunit SRP54
MIKSLLSEKLQSVFKHVRGFGKLSESNISEALREVRMALLAADVNYQVAKQFCDKVKEKSLGEEVQISVRPGELFVKIVHDELLNLFSQGDNTISSARPLRIALCGLNGAGKTTTASKLALYLKKQGLNVLLIAADLTRPAAIQQLQTLGKQIDVPVIVPQEGDKILSHLKKARSEAENQKADVTIYDMAGRLEIDEELLRELNEAVKVIEPQECLLVADAATGQIAVQVAESFKKAAPLTGVILSKFDGDTKGGAALSFQQVIECPIKFVGTGEQPSAFEVFHPERLVSRMLGMGDILSLVEKAQFEFDEKDALKMQEKLKNQNFDLQDFLDQMKAIKKLGPLQNLLGMMPGMSNIPSSALDEKSLKRTEAIILSMTFQERHKPEIINARRRQRMASGSGTSVREVNELLNRFQNMKKMMKKLMGGNLDSKMKRMFGGMKLPF